ncbi:uncharacterized protein LOC117324139 isoform X1 [Pecten maximus]|uniref:uncharacterized protein LOC117324139 isoform X1 n=1 Tax=Pecten maximus TaxID=6579 RepID=UPI001458833B|nr:uncharacterized protein LOC117324139 isoform X1 [Pecten maximus]
MASTAKLNKNICAKLHLRETFGAFQRHRRSFHQRIFSRIPARLCYRLKSLVSQDILEEGHVFLGFTKCGRFVVSYSCQMMSDEHLGFPSYNYALQWWKFIPDSPLIKASEVKLFGEEDVTQDLFISFCEWPQDHSKVLVFGHSLPGQDPDSCCQCYFTITSFPATATCLVCQQLRTGGKKEATLPKRCLQHGYSVHTKFELTPPFPPFAPRTQLKINGVAVVNTGDSIIALHVAIGNSTELAANEVLCLKKTTEGDSKGSNSATERPVLLRSESTLSEVCCECGFKIQDSENWEQNDDSQKENVKKHVLKEYFKQRSPKPSPGHSDIQGRSPKPSSATDWYSEHQGKSPRSSCGEWNNEFHGWSPKSGDKHVDCHEMERKNGGICDANSPDCFDFSCESPSIGPSRRDRSISRTTYQQQQSVDYKNVMSPKMDNAANNTSDIKNVMSPKSDNSSINNCTPRTSPRANVVEGKGLSVLTDGCCPACGAPTVLGVTHGGRSGGPGNTTPSIGNRIGLSGSNTNLTGTPQNNKIILSGTCNSSGTPLVGSQRSFWSPSISSGTSRSTDSIYLQTNESKTVSYMVRTFTQMDIPGDQDRTVPTDDDLDLAYRSVLPIEVVTGDNHPMCPALPLDHCQEGLRITQMTFDVEHYLEEIIGHTASWGHRYVAFTNYDLQILDVCPDTNAVIGKVFVLIHAREESDNPKRKRRQAVKLYQTSFCFSWSLVTGGFDTLSADCLTEVDELNIRRQEWKPGHKECSSLRRQLFIPQSSQRHVNVLSNESVFKGKSLSMIISPHLHVAIVM